MAPMQYCTVTWSRSLEGTLPGIAVEASKVHTYVVLKGGCSSFIQRHLAVLAFTDVPVVSGSALLVYK